MTTPGSSHRKQAESAKSPADAMLIAAFSKLDAVALGIAVGLICGTAVALATAYLLIKGGPNMGANMGLLGQFFLGYTVSPAGCLVGFAYGTVGGFVLGWVTAKLHFLALFFYAHLARLKANLDAISHLHDSNNIE
jgi:hypothetical protein